MRDISIDCSSTKEVYSEHKKIPPSIQLPTPIGNRQPFRDEVDTFRMKAITLLREHKISFSSFKEHIHQAPIMVVEEAPREKLSSGSIVTLLQTLSIPGETIQLKGVFKRQSAGIRSIPIPESFQLIK